MQKRRQSKDFKEIWNVQTGMKVTDEDWDAAFHNYDDPENCPGRKRVTGCTVCDKLKKGKDYEDTI